jgi:hypothetical protein
VKFLAALNNAKVSFLERYLNYIFPVVAFTFAFYLQISIAFFGLDLHHDLLMFDAARNLYSGQIPYKDFFYQYNLGTLFLHGAALSVLGLKIISLKEITVVFYALIALLIYLSCALEGYRRSGLLLSILWALLSPFYMPAMNGYHPWSTVYMMASCMIGILFLQLAIRKPPLIFSLLAGVFFSLSFWFKQVAAYQIIVVGIWLIISILLYRGDRVEQRKYIKIFLGFAAGGVVMSIPFFSYLYVEAGLKNWWTDAIEFNRHFSSDSQNASGIKLWLKTLFPISREMGYKSFFWALSPIVLCILALQVFLKRGIFFGLLKSQKEVLSLIILMGFTGWLQYFPLPHPFHTQLFIAPVFVVVGFLLAAYSASLSELKKYPLITCAFLVFFISAGYEGIRHVDGWIKKRSFYGQDAIQMDLNSTFDELKLKNSEADKLVKFYSSLLELKVSSIKKEFIPFSVDSIRGLLPGIVDHPIEFKMGVNWTWPNELAEPGFIDRYEKELRLRQRPLYADSLIYVEGYKPISVLEMKSPISWIHTLYKPLEQASKIIVKTNKSKEILYATNNDFEIVSRNTFLPWSSNQISFNLIPFNELSESELKKIRNITISTVEETDFPRHLSSLQMNYLKKISNYYGGNLHSLFKLDNQGGGILSEGITKEEEKNLAFFMLSTGKLFKSQNHPLYSSTLSHLDTEKPFIVRGSLGGPHQKKFYIIGSDSTNFSNPIPGQDGQIYFAIKPIFKKQESLFMIIQIELQNGHMKNYFYSFIDE